MNPTNESKKPNVPYFNQENDVPISINDLPQEILQLILKEDPGNYPAELLTDKKWNKVASQYMESLKTINALCDSIAPAQTVTVPWTTRFDILTSSSDKIVYGHNELAFYDTTTKVGVADTSPSPTYFVRRTKNGIEAIKGEGAFSNPKLTLRNLSDEIQGASQASVAPGRNWGVKAASFNDLIAFTGADGEEIVVFDPSKNQSYKIENPFADFYSGRQIVGIALTSDRVVVACSCGRPVDTYVAVYDFKGLLIGKINTENRSSPAEIAANEQLIAVLFTNNQIKFYDSKTLKEISTIEKVNLGEGVSWMTPMKLQFHADKLFVFLQNNVKVFDSDGKLLNTLESQNHFKYNFMPLFTFQGKYLVVGFKTAEKTYCVDLYENGRNGSKFIHSFPVKGTYLENLDFDLDEMQLLVASQNRQDPYDRTDSLIEVWNPVIAAKNNILALRKADKDQIAAEAKKLIAEEAKAEKVAKAKEAFKAKAAAKKEQPSSSDGLIARTASYISSFWPFKK